MCVWRERGKMTLTNLACMMNRSLIDLRRVLQTSESSQISFDQRWINNRSMVIVSVDITSRTEGEKNDFSYLSSWSIFQRECSPLHLTIDSIALCFLPILHHDHHWERRECTSLSSCYFSFFYWQLSHRNEYQDPPDDWHDERALTCLFIQSIVW